VIGVARGPIDTHSTGQDNVENTKIPMMIVKYFEDLGIVKK
jgi:hypothetical protein